MRSKEALEILVKQANERKLSNKIVANGIAVSVLEKLVEQAQKQEKLIELQDDLITELSKAEHAQSYDVIDYIKNKIKELENE